MQLAVLAITEFILCTTCESCLKKQYTELDCLGRRGGVRAKEGGGGGGGRGKETGGGNKGSIILEKRIACHVYACKSSKKKYI